MKMWLAGERVQVSAAAECEICESARSWFWLACMHAEHSRPGIGFRIRTLHSMTCSRFQWVWRAWRGRGASFRNYLVHSSAFKLITRQHNIFQKQTAGVYNHNKITPCAQHTHDKAAAAWQLPVLLANCSPAHALRISYVMATHRMHHAHTKISLFLYNKHLFIVCYCDVDAAHINFFDMRSLYPQPRRERKEICAETALEGAHAE